MVVGRRGWSNDGVGETINGPNDGGGGGWCDFGCKEKEKEGAKCTNGGWESVWVFKIK